MSFEALCAIGGIPPVDLLAKEKRMNYEGTIPKHDKNKEKEQWTKALIPHLVESTRRKHGEVDYW